MTAFEFVDAPPRGTRSSKTDPILIEFADALRAHPGQWAKWPVTVSSPVYASSIASRINNGLSNAPALFRAGFEATSSKGVIYVRFVGGAA